MSDKITEESFLKDVATHQMQIIRDDGVNRHVRFKKPGTMCSHFDLITWPGYLCYTGDMGTYVFRRLHDMFAFFRQRPFEKGEGLYINRGYWAEKIEAADRCCGVKVFTTEKFEKRLREELEEYIGWNGNDWDDGYADELRERLADDVLRYADDGEHAGRQAAAEFEVDGDEVFTDLWEYDFTDWTLRYTWCCYALAWAVKQYDAAKAAQKAKPEDDHRDYRDDDVCHRRPDRRQLMTTKPTSDNAGQAAAVYAAECAKLREERDRLRADLNAAKTALENQIAHTTEIANLCARQRAWIDGVMAQGIVGNHLVSGRIRNVIYRPAPFEDK